MQTFPQRLQSMLFVQMEPVAHAQVSVQACPSVGCAAAQVPEAMPKMLASNL